MGRLEDTSVFLYSDWLHFVWRSKEKTIVKKQNFIKAAC